jgi:hypothetical protein
MDHQSSNMYYQSSFYDIYGGSIFLSSIVCIVFVIILCYSVYAIFLDHVRNNWNKLQCTPPYMLLADKVIKDPSRTSQQIREDNFNLCLDEIEKTSFKTVEPQLQTINESLKKETEKVNISLTQTDEDIEKVKEIQESHYDSISGTFKYIGFVSQNIVSQMKDFLSRFAAMSITGVYAMEKSFDAFITGLQRMRNVVIAMITMMALFIVFLLPSIFLSPVLTTILILTTAMSGILPIVGIMTHTIAYSKTLTDPNIVTAACFHESTPLVVNDTMIPISYIVPGDIIGNNVKVTSTIKILCPKNQKIIRYKGIIMTNEHRIHKGNLCIETECIPGAEEIDESPTFLYCLNTDNKRIPIFDEEFTDWDDLDKREIKLLKHYCKLNNTFEFHQRFTTGFHPDTMIVMSGNKDKHIKDIECGEYTIKGEQIIGIVQSYGGNIPLYTCDNLIMTDHMIVKNNSFMLTPISEKCSTLYHVITDTKYIHIGNYCFRDYDGPIENILTS